MSYRNDHEAALHRVDALEQEVARLRTAAPRPAATKPAPRASLFRIVLATALIAGGIAAVVARDRPTVAADPAPVIAKIEEKLASRDKPSLKDCIAAIAPIDRAVDEVTTDPRGSAESVKWIEKTAAPCRTEIRSFTTGPDDTAVLVRWANAEDRLADPISMIGVYYGQDPYRLDNYSTAAQLWREYHRARIARDDALAQVKLALGS